MILHGDIGSMLLDFGHVDICQRSIDESFLKAVAAH